MKAGIPYEKPISSLDIFATVAAHVNGDRNLVNPLDGTDLIPFINGIKKGSPHDFLYWCNHDQQRFTILHHSGLKEISIKDSLIHQFNLASDLSEVNDRHSRQTKQSGQFEKHRRRWERMLVLLSGD